ncbi:MAG: tail fiber domain-containing protein [Flavobacteriales bacterium]
MGVGLTLTGNADHSYFGQKVGEQLDYTDVVLHWSDNPTKFMKDRMRFIFTMGYNSANTTGASSLEGLEAMRLFPPNEDDVYVGLGDFYAGNLSDPVNVVEPTERLDILNGRLRIRELPTGPAASTLTKFLVTDANGVIHWRNVPTSPGGPGCEWINTPWDQTISSGIGTPVPGSTCPDRGWLYRIGYNGASNAKLNLFQNSNERNVISGLTTELITKTGSVQESYGIRSLVSPEAGQSAFASHGVWSWLREPTGAYGTGVYGKVTKTNTSSVTDMVGTWGSSRVESTGSATRVHGSYGEVVIIGAAQTSIGVSGRSDIASPSSTIAESIGINGVSVVSGSTATTASGGKFSSSTTNNGTITDGYGIQAISNKGSGFLSNSCGVFARGLNGTNNNYGVRAFAQGVSGSVNYGVHAGTGWNVNNVDWAGYFTGAVYSPYGTWQPSDENLKSNVADFDASTATDILNSIQLHTYRYDREQHPQMNLPEGDQLGVLAQELEAVLPNSVRTAVEPEVRNEEGELEYEAVEFKAVNYGSLIPYLIGAYQEEHRSRVALEERMGRLEDQLAACCANPDGVRSLPQGSNELTSLGNDLTGTHKLRIQPNPFNERTTVYYTVDSRGRTQLLANSSDGRELRVLQEANLEAGSYQFEWDTTSMAPGLYYVTLLVDGEPVVKKAVKVDR